MPPITLVSCYPTHTSKFARPSVFDLLIPNKCETELTDLDANWQIHIVLDKTPWSQGKKDLKRHKPQQIRAIAITCNCKLQPNCQCCHPASANEDSAFYHITLILLLLLLTRNETGAHLCWHDGEGQYLWCTTSACPGPVFGRASSSGVA